MVKNIILKRLSNIIRKEWGRTFYNLNSALLIISLPIIITAQALLYIYLIVRYAGTNVLTNTILQIGVEKLEQAMPSLSTLSAIQKFQVFFYLQFPIYLLFVPAIIAISFAMFSIIEEKQAHTLEPLLATPVRTWELLLGKTLAGAIPAVTMSWVSAGIFLIGMVWLGSSHLLRYVLVSAWWISLLLLVPLITILSFMLGVIASSRANDPRNAQNTSVLIVLPVLGIIAVQLIGLTIFTPLKLILVAVVVLVLDIITLRAASFLFQRESIVVRWR